MRNVSIVEFPKEKYKPVTQLSHYITCEFAFVNEKYEEIMQRVTCKDFMNVPNWAMKTGNVDRVYGWTYNFKETPYDLNVTRISFYFPNNSQRANFIKNIGYLNEIEKEYEIGLTEILSTQDEEVLIVEGDKVWQSNCWKMSMYMMYLRRIAHTNPAKPYSTSSDHNTMQYFKNHKNCDKNLMTYIHESFDEFQNEFSVSAAHSSSGGISMASYQEYITYKEEHKNMSAWSRRAMEMCNVPNPNFKQLKEAA